MKRLRMQTVSYTHLDVYKRQALHNAAVFQHNNGVGIAYGGKPVGDNKDGTALHLSLIHI